MGHELVKAMLWASYLQGTLPKHELDESLSRVETEQIENTVMEHHDMDEFTRHQLLHIPKWKVN